MPAVGLGSLCSGMQFLVEVVTLGSSQERSPLRFFSDFFQLLQKVSCMGDGHNGISSRDSGICEHVIIFIGVRCASS